MPSHTVKYRRGRVRRVTRWIPIRCMGCSPTRQIIRALVGDSKGSLLLETVVSVMVFSMVGTAVIAGLNTAYTTGAKVEEQATAENVARNQMELVFSQAYEEPGQTPYPTITPPTGYTVTTTTEDVDPYSPDPDIEKVIVTVSHDGQDILVLDGMRFNDD